MPVEQVDTGVGHRRADGGVAARAVGVVAHVGGGARHGRLGRAIGIDQSGMGRAYRVPHLQLLHRQGIAGDVDQAHITQMIAGLRRRVVPFGRQGVPMRRGQVQEGRPDLNVLLQLDAAKQRAGRRQSGTGDQRRENFFHRQVEVQRVLLQHRVGRRQFEQAHGIHAVVDQTPVFDHHALGRAGRTGGVDHVGQVTHAEARHHRVVFAACGNAAAHPFDVVEQHHRRSQWRQAVLQCALGQQRYRGTVGNHVSQSFGGICRIQRHVTAAGLEYRQQAHQHLGAALDTDRYAVVRTDAQPDQVMGQLVGLAIQFGVAQALTFEHHGNGLRPGRDLGLEELMDGLFTGVRCLVRVEPDQQTLAFGVIHQRDLFDQRLVTCHHGTHHPLEITEVTLHRGLVEQSRGVFQGAEDLPLGLAEFQGQVELGDIVRHTEAFERQVAKHQFAVVEGLPGQHGLEQRAVGQAAYRIEHFHHLLERQVLMRLGA